MKRKHIVFLTGAGISAESGLNTFRGKDGLWTQEEFRYSAKCVATEGMIRLLEEGCGL